MARRGDRSMRRSPKMAGAMGYSYALARDAKPDYENKLPKARAEYRAHKEALAKKSERMNGKKRK